ncbi:hypothetical protein ACH5RR_029797 [Cinchona calisaya]|uniref:NAC domain-containing protein n=1 Tax=Cinchona calisaya TaxID=153742 RepID=A0ABD2YSP3_9GENT
MKPLRKYPPEYKFAPSEQDLLFYLPRKVNNAENDDEEKVPLKFVDIYEITDPGLLFEDTEEDLVYIFTQFRRVSQDGTGKSFEKNKKKLGYNMKEITLDDSIPRDAKFKDYVVCRIKRKSKKKEESTEETLTRRNIRRRSCIGYT